MLRVRAALPDDDDFAAELVCDRRASPVICKQRAIWFRAAFIIAVACDLYPASTHTPSRCKRASADVACLFQLARSVFSVGHSLPSPLGDVSFA